MLKLLSGDLLNDKVLKIIMKCLSIRFFYDKMPIKISRVFYQLKNILGIDLIRMNFLVDSELSGKLFKKF